jgi:preprotein translocase subunit SecF
MVSKAFDGKTGPIDVVKHRWYYILFSLLLLVPGIIFMTLSIKEYPTHSPVRLGIDFTGGTILEYGFEKPVTQQDIPAIRKLFEERGYAGPVIQIQEPREDIHTESKEKSSVNQEEIKTLSTPLASEQAPNNQANVAPSQKAEKITTVVSIRSKQLQGNDAEIIRNALEKQFGSLTLLQKNSIGPTLASELFKNGLLALILAYVLIVGYLTIRFQFDYAICAIVALVHDTITVFGIFSMLGFLFHTEVDSMFVTGILTVVGFSVHDTIVVFDRLRENTRLLYTQKLPFGTIANISVNQTLARSVNTSLTALLTLLALYFFGGETTRDFVLCMICGIAIGTYSSIFVASAMLTWWRERSKGSGSQTVASATA